jgi:hypothetical protein
MALMLKAGLGNPSQYMSDQDLIRYQFGTETLEKAKKAKGPVEISTFKEWNTKMNTSGVLATPFQEANPELGSDYLAYYRIIVTVDAEYGWGVAKKYDAIMMDRWLDDRAEGYYEALQATANFRHGRLLMCTEHRVLSLAREPTTKKDLARTPKERSGETCGHCGKLNHNKAECHTLLAEKKRQAAAKAKKLVVGQ